MNNTKSTEKHPFILPGNYDGIWCAYYIQIIFHNGNKSEHIKVNNGIRGISSCKIEVDNDGWVYVND